MATSSQPKAPRVVIVGAGFGGLRAARELRHAPVEITLIDRRNYHLFQPLLYQVATAALNPSDIAAPVRSVLRRQSNVEVLLAEVHSIDCERRRVRTSELELEYDYLIVASGATHSYFGHSEWTSLAPGLKTIENALEIRRRILLAFEKAEYESDPDEKRAWLTFVVVGAGPTGVEMAGAISEIARHTLARDFRHVDPSSALVYLVEAAPRVLPPYPPELSAAAEEQLKRLGVHVRTSAEVLAIDDSGVTVAKAERIPARSVIWGAGVAASELGRTLGAPLDRAGRVRVAPDLSLPEHPEVFVIGDLASVMRENGTPVPGVAPAAIQEGSHAARNLLRAIRGQERLAFRYRNKGSLATIGRAAAVAEIGRVYLTGLVAWLAWLMIHIFFLIGFRNRFSVLLQWAYSYITYRRGARLITGEDEAAPRPVIPKSPPSPLGERHCSE